MRLARSFKHSLDTAAGKSFHANVIGRGLLDIGLASGLIDLAGAERRLRQSHALRHSWKRHAEYRGRRTAQRHRRD